LNVQSVLVLNVLKPLYTVEDFVQTRAIGSCFAKKKEQLVVI